MESIFKPVFLDDLVDFLYENESPEVKKFKTKELLSHDNNKGLFWESVLAKAMAFHTVPLKFNAWHMDFSDGTDAKFAQFHRWSPSGTRCVGTKAATINCSNKTGPLRICLCVQGQYHHKLYFMFIPYEYHSKNYPKHPLKITFDKNFKPCGDAWEKFNCSWEEVIKPLVANPITPKYFDEYQFLIEAHKIKQNIFAC